MARPIKNLVKIQQPKFVTCKHCRFWDEDIPLNRKNHFEDKELGYCRRKSPILVSDTDTPTLLCFSNWPVTEPDDWCGEGQE